MSEKKSVIVNQSSTDFLPALAYRAAVVTYSKRNYMTKKEAAEQGIDLTPVSAAVQRKASIETARGIKAKMEDPTNVGEFAQKMLGGPVGVGAYEADFVETTPDKADLEYHFCPLVQAWQSMGLSDEEIGELCDSAMVGDHIIAEEMGFTLDLQKAIAKGDHVCKLVFTKKKDQ